MLVVIFGWQRKEPRKDYVTIIDIVPGDVKRGSGSSSANTGDRIRVQLHPADEIRVYRSTELVFRCAKHVTTADCTHDSRGSIGAYTLAAAGEYTVVIATEPVVEPRGSLDKDLAAIVSASGKYRTETLSVW